MKKLRSNFLKILLRVLIMQIAKHVIGEIGETKKAKDVKREIDKLINRSPKKGKKAQKQKTDENQLNLLEEKTS